MTGTAGASPLAVPERPAGADPTVLVPDDPFPDDLMELPLVALQVLHSRLCRQLEREHRDPGGPHPLTLDRLRDVGVELDSRLIA
ncbi:hypothetical protein AS188_00855 [Kocuria flava]|uniref:Uncharacterized protein n=1 Tax=Kocuria flava TaxID=446860 RepID=A0A0U3HCN9_9MICC|nr:hypothetical protein [Kocuria flava]ALU38536.1 hypothetical protein AS188_00855 [Kocuria flava]GEO92805.1 hypothetical protein KFL01_21110 [Kocuria flava]